MEQTALRLEVGGKPREVETCGSLEPEKLYALALEAPRAQEPGTCVRCRLSQRPGLKTVCMAASGEPGGLLVVGESPGTQEDEPFAGISGQLLRAEVRKNWTGSVAYTHAARCAAGDDIDEKSVAACRGFLREDIERLRPTRILAAGSWAAYALTGEALAPMSARKAYGFVLGIPTFFVLPPTDAARNRFVRRWFEADVAWALKADPPNSPTFWAAPQVPEEACQALRELRDARLPVAFDCETAGEMWTPEFRILCVALSNDPERAVVLSEEVLRDAGVRDELRLLMEDLSVPKVGQNWKYDRHSLRSAFGIAVRGVPDDTRVMRKLLESEAAGDLDTMSWLVGLGGMKAESVAALKKIKIGLRHAFADLRPEVLWRRCAGDAVATLRLCRRFSGELDAAPELRAVYRDLAAPAVEAFAWVEEWGVLVSRDRLAVFQTYLESRYHAAQKQIMSHPEVTRWREENGEDFNAESPKQLATMLFDRMKLPVVRTTDAGHRSTDEATLAALADREPWVAGLLEMRKVQKLKGTYADGLLEKIRPDGRIHASFNVDGAASGRTSSSNPNLQNIPTAASPEGKMARDLFVAPLGWVILSVDYSQLELRVMAMLSRDPVMTADFKSGLDIHRQTAASIFKVAPEDVTDKQRKIAKTIVFGLAYGKSDENFADDLGVSIAEARRYREGILGRYQRFAQWQTSLWKEAQAAGLSWTWWAGRRARRRQLWRAGNEQDRQAFAHARNQTMNTPVQGTASEFCVASLIECVRWIRDEDVPARVTMAVHDELDFEVREDALPWVAKRVRQIMLSHDSAGVPLAVDLEFGKSWGSLEPYKEPQGDAEHDSRGPKGPSR